MHTNFIKSLAAIALSAALTTFTPTTALAHHGMDFLTVQSYEVPGSLGAYLFTDFEWERTNGDNEYGLEPGLLLGLFPRTALEVTTSFGQEVGGDWRFQSVTPSLFFQLTPPDSKCPFRVALSAGYEFADEEGEVEEEHHEEEGHHDEADHHEEAGHTHGSGGHQHGVDGFEGRFIVEYEAGDWLLASNLTVDTDAESSAVWGYAVGARYRVCQGFATGVEAQGEFGSEGSHELIAGFYLEPMHSAVIKLGAGFGLNDHSPDFALHAGVVWKF